MTLVPVALPTKSSPARYTQGGTGALVNGYVERIGEEGRVPWQIVAIDGLAGFAALPEATGGVRAMLDVDGMFYAVAGSALYRVAPNGEVTALGSMNISATAPVYMERNRAATPDILIVCDGLAYNYDTTLAQVTDVDLLAPTSLAFLAGYFLIGTANNTWQIGALDDGMAWDALDFERADANPDAVVRVAAMQRDAVIFGERSIEFWRHDPPQDGGFPFQFVTSADIGILAAASVVTIEQTLAFVASDRTVRMLAGYEARRISDHSVERAIEDLPDRSIIRGTTWVRDGHTFYALTAPGYWSWCYDTTTGLWHQRMSYERPDWRVSLVTTFGNKLIAGDSDSGILYEMSPDFADEAGQPIVVEATLPPTHMFPHSMTCDAVYFDVERGVGLGTGAIEDVAPSIMFRWSRDGGATFAGERALAIGAQGKRVTRVRTHRLGQFSELGAVFRLSCNAKVARSWYQVMADITQDAA
jgi:hypothetical protein